MASSHGLVFLLCILATFVGRVVLDLKVTVPKCCQLGINWQYEGLKCQDYPAPVLDVPDSDQETCLKTIQLCCKEQLEHKKCQRGIKTFKTEKTCPESDPASENDVLAKCCESCQLGKILGESKMNCLFIDFPGTEQLKKVIRTCCSEINPPKITKKPKKGENNQSLPHESAYDSYDDYDIPTPVPDNLCDLLPGQLCAQICVPTHGSYFCKCEEGFVLMEDQKTCQKNTSQPAKQKPIVPQVIVPNPEKPVPLHKPKDKAASRSSVPSKAGKCADSNPCEQECTDTESGFKCGCRAGYAIDTDGKSCKDVNECLNATYVCEAGVEECVNEVGGYRCVKIGKVESTSKKIESTTTPPTVSTASPATTALPLSPTSQTSENGCPVGYDNEFGECTDVDECDQTKYPEVCDPDHDCINTPGSYECRCKTGFKENSSTGQCEDINECQTKLHSCLASQRCDNTIGSYQCIRFTGCGTGYTLNSQNGLCEDDDECALGTDTCRFLGPNYICKNTMGSFRCERKRCQPGDPSCDPTKQCPTGYEQDESGHCVDVNECASGTHNCHPFADICINKVGSFECRKVVHCPKGYEATAAGCKDVDECATNRHTCRGLAECKNENGGFSCHCPTGYQLAADSSCLDINECSFYMCPYNSKCVNTPGSYRCDCNIGFRNVDLTTCQDIDECSATPGICEHNCINVFGSYRCTCKTGFRLNENNRTCVDLDECEMFKDERLCIGECVNIPGSFSCRCPPGYILSPDGRSCQDVDECARNPCTGEDEVCLNTRGGYKCNSVKCPPTYVKDPLYKNKCVRSNFFCRKDDLNCLQQPEVYSFNFITFVSMLPIPPIGYLDLLTMRAGQKRHIEQKIFSKMNTEFTLDLLSARAGQTVPPATKEFFRLRNSGLNQKSVCLVKPIPGPQDVELQLTMKVYDGGKFRSSAVAKVLIYVSQFEY